MSIHFTRVSGKYDEQVNDHKNVKNVTEIFI